MKITIHQPLSVNKIGKRGKNQDSIFPSTDQADATNQVFVVCDGVGGAASGEVASRLSADTIGRYFENKTATFDTIEAAVQKAQIALDGYLSTNENSKGMGTTLTFMQLHTQGATIAHIGDSRVYHIRKNHILFCTDDHSLINEMRKKGMDNLEDVKSNIITRALQGKSVKAVKADVHYISDIQKGDYFLLCSDGIWGTIPDSKMLQILEGNTSNQEKIEYIDALCEVSSHDNYSAYLLQIASVSDEDKTQLMGSDNDKTLTIEPIYSEPQPNRIESPLIEKSQGYSPQNLQIEVTQKPRVAKWVIPVLIIVTIAVISWLVINNN
jgi:PPM family protein phosphatase